MLVILVRFFCLFLFFSFRVFFPLFEFGRLKLNSWVETADFYGVSSGVENSGFDRGIKSAPWQRTQIYMQTKYKLIDGNNNNNNKTSYHNPITVSKMADDGAKASNFKLRQKQNGGSQF